MKWIAMSERKPTREDADKNGRILFRWGDESCGSMRWDEALHCASVTHWTQLQNIELPPAPPEMPERLEFVKAKEGEIGDGRSICCINATKEAYSGAGIKTSPDYTLYRRVEPGKRIVFEVKDFREPEKGEWIIARDKTFILTANDNYSVNTPRTILRVVEGEEYLK